MIRYITFTFLFYLIISFNAHASEQIKDKNLLSAVTGGNAEKYQKAIEYIKTNRPPDLPRLLKEEYLDDDDENVRERIISALKEYPALEQYAIWIELLKITKDKKNEAGLIEFLSSIKHGIFTVPVAEKLLVPRCEAREKAAIMLKKHGDDRMMPVILSLGQSKNPIDRIYFLEALNHLYDIRFQKLVISMIEDANKSVRIYAIKCINNNEVKEALPALRRLAAKDDNAESRIMAISSLVSFKDTQSGSMLTGILKEENAEIKAEAIRALRELKYSNSAGPLSDMLLKKESPDIRHAVLDTLISFRKTGNMSSLKHLIKNDPDPKIRIKAVYAIGAAGENRDSAETLKEALLDEDYRVRGEACSSLGYLKKSGASEILINQIKTDKSRYVRTAALYAVVRINDSKNIIKLFDIYSFEEDRVFRELLRGVIRNSIKKGVR